MVSRPRPRGGKYSMVKGGSASDVPQHMRSSWERNIFRLLRHLWLHVDGYGQRYALRYIRRIDYEHCPFFFPGEAKGNYRIFPDFRLLSADVATGRIDEAFLEVKGLLRRGGWLPVIDLEQLRGVDDDSRIRLARFKRHYEPLARRTWVIGEREYRWLEKRYGRLVPGWEFPRLASGRRNA